MNAGGRTKVLVTGATGFVGRNLVEALLDRGDEVIALVRAEGSAADLEERGARIARGDIRDRRAVEAAAAGTEVIIHLAVSRRSASFRHQRAITVDGARNVLRAAHRTGVGRIVHCSTVGVHGRLRSLPADESAPLRPVTAYQKAKAEAEHEVQRHALRHGTPVVILRPTMIYGPGSLASLELYRSILSGRMISVGRAAHPYHVVYVDDLVQAFLLATEVDDAVGETFVIADAEALPQVEFFRAIAAAGGVPFQRRVVPAWPLAVTVRAANAILRPFDRHLVFTKTLHFFSQPRSFDIAKARELLGYSPRVTPEEGVRRAVEWYRSEGHLPR